MKNAFVFLALLIAVTGCSSKQSKTSVKDVVPLCIKEALAAIEKKTMENPPVQVDEYLYNGKRVFLYTADCCDQYNTLYDENCKMICAPSGGITGKGDLKCPGFSDEARHIKILWSRKDKGK